MSTLQLQQLVGAELRPITLHPYVPPSGGLIDPTSPAGVQPVGHTGLTLAFSDEFNGPSVDYSKWLDSYPDNAFWNTTVPGGHRSNTGEPQAYQRDGAAIVDGAVRFTMRNESTIPGLPYTSGMLCSQPSFAQRYGYFEARMRTTNAPWSWSAFWLFPADHSWPPEIDIMEFWGGWDGATVWSSVHWPSPNAHVTDDHRLTGSGADGWHTYGALWEPGRVRFYVDGVLSFDYSDSRVSATEMYIICNLAGSKDNTTAPSALPMTCDIDYIRAWTA